MCQAGSSQKVLKALTVCLALCDYWYNKTYIYESYTCGYKRTS